MKKSIKTVVIAVVLTVATAFTTLAAQKDGWVQEGEGYRYYDSYYYGTYSPKGYVSNELIDLDNYYVDSTGWLLKNNYTVSGYWVNEEGKLDAGKTKRNEYHLPALGTYRLVDEDGNIVTVKYEYGNMINDGSAGVITYSQYMADTKQSDTMTFYLRKQTYDGMCYGAYVPYRDLNDINSAVPIYITVDENASSFIRLSYSGNTYQANFVEYNK